ncbi:ComF family protein [Candidatus Saccharibacteria bacterium]|nr:ComF family protein [Candidatus Saccharibacteria bacterium]
MIYVTKFGRVKAGANAIAKAMNAVLPGDYKTVTYVPTTSKRRRQRGYDQAELIAKAIARQRGWKVVSLLRRANDSRQLGASRYQRQKQARASFEVKRLQNETIEPILLIDDVITTGSSVRSCVKLLHEMGFLTVDVAVFAYTQSKQK